MSPYLVELRVNQHPPKRAWIGETMFNAMTRLGWLENGKAKLIERKATYDGSRN